MGAAIIGPPMPPINSANAAGNSLRQTCFKFGNGKSRIAFNLPRKPRYSSLFGQRVVNVFGQVKASTLPPRFAAC